MRRRIARGIDAYEREDFEAAIETFDAVIAEAPGFADLHNKRALCLAMLDRVEEAIEGFEEAIRLGPTYAEAHLNLGIMLQLAGRHDDAQHAFDQASRLDQRDGSAFPSDVGNQIAVQHAKLGDLYLVADHPHEAEREYYAALKVRPRYLDIRTKLAEARLELHDIAGALDELELVLEDNPGFTTARLKYGVALHRSGRTEEAIAEWRRCMRDAPDEMRARAYLASVGVRVRPESVEA
ncbi:MAG: tetratricopeptide repeat protein [Longimicrobiales bacterium]|nr:tetratricopeptide repeat protein [Longimicrobiales bacterium]